jgi:uncharacterized protein
MIYVLFHDSCSDGFTAAYVAWKKFGDKATYIPIQYGKPLPEIPDQSEVYILDFSYSKQILEDLWKRSLKLVVLDHHKTAEQELSGLPYAWFDQKECGATLSWKHFFPEQPMPELLLHIRARDLWLWDQPKSREINAALSIQDRTFEHWDELFSYPICDFVKAGEIILIVQDRQVKGLVEKAYIHQISQYNVPVVNSSLYQSEIGEALCKKYPDNPFSGVYFWKDEKTRIWSLRSIGEFDVSEIAKSLGGGGHRNAAGFMELNHAQC